MKTHNTIRSTSAVNDDDGVLAEQERLLANLDPTSPVIFRSNHASNCLALAGNLPRDRDRLMDLLQKVMLDNNDSGRAPLKTRDGE